MVRRLQGQYSELLEGPVCLKAPGVIQGQTSRNSEDTVWAFPARSLLLMVPEEVG